MKFFHQFYEQAVASAPAPAPAAAPKVAKAQSKAPKVTDPSSGVDIDDDGRWKGDIVDQGKVIEPERKIKVKDGKKGPDPDLPSGEANPNKKKKDYGDIAAAGVPRNTGGSSSGDPNNIQWPRDKYPNKKAPPGPGARTANVPGTTDYGNVAATYGGAEAEKQKKIDAWMKKHFPAGSPGGGGYKPGKGRGMGDTWEGPVRDA